VQLARVPSILFLCVANSARSQIAEGFARGLLGSNAVVASAGTRPKHVDPYAIAVMREYGIDLRSHRAKSVGAIDPAGVDLLVLVCSDDVCPSTLAHVPQFRWSIADPVSGDPTITHDEMLARFRRARDAIRERVLELAGQVRNGELDRCWALHSTQNAGVAETRSSQGRTSD
jgi:arsenate reductase